MKQSIKKYQLNGWRKIAAWSFGLIWLVLPIWLTSAQDAPTQDFDAGKVEVVGDEPLAPESLVTLLPYGASGFRYQILPSAAPTPVGFEQPAYNDSSWSQGAAAFGSVTGCQPPTTIRTDWAINTRLLTRKKFTIPTGAVNVRVTYIVDNDMEKFWFNGTLVDQGQTHNNCPELDWKTVTIPNNLLVAGENTLAFQTLDRGQQTYFDVKVVATTNDPEPGQCAIVAPTPIAWWNGQNNANDIVNGHNGYALNGVQYGAGKVGQSFSFDGVNEVMIPTNANLNANVFSLSVWVNPSQIDADYTRVISKSGSYAIELMGDGRLAYYISGVSGLPNEVGGGRTYGGATIPLNQWTHVALSYDGARARTYINGRVSREIVGLTGNVAINTGTFVIGSEQGLTGTAKFDGKIDEVQYFSSPLTPTEMRTIYDSDNQGICTGVAANRTKFDFDGDGRADVSVFRPSNGAWYLNQSTAGFTGITFGIETDKLVPGDYDGDGKTDVAVYRDGTWYLQRSTAGYVGISFGAATDIPYPADFDGDGKTDVAVFRPSNGTWYILQSRDGSLGVQFGTSADVPVAADYDGDGKADLALRRESGAKDGLWFVRRSSDGSVLNVPFGFITDKAVPADYDGDGKTDIAVFRNGNWYIAQSRDGFKTIQFGIATDVPTAADYDGDGKADAAVFRDGFWYLNRTTAGFAGVAFGAATDKPIPNVFVP